MEIKTFILACVWGRVSLSWRRLRLDKAKEFRRRARRRRRRKSPGSKEFVSRLTAHIKMILKFKIRRKRKRRNKRYRVLVFLLKEEEEEEDFLGKMRRSNLVSRQPQEDEWTLYIDKRDVEELCKRSTHSQVYPFLLFLKDTKRKEKSWRKMNDGMVKLWPTLPVETENWVEKEERAWRREIERERREL